MPSNTFTVTASAPTVVSDTGPATVLNSGPGTVFYKADETVSATVYDGTIASGGSLTILSTTALIAAPGSSASVSVTPLPWNPNLDTSGKLPVAQVPVVSVSPSGDTSGVTDTANLQAAFAKSWANGNTEVLLPPGVFTVNDRIHTAGGTTTNPICLRGVPGQTIIQRTVAQCIVEVVGSFSGGQALSADAAAGATTVTVAAVPAGLVAGGYARVRSEAILVVSGVGKTAEIVQVKSITGAGPFTITFYGALEETYLVANTATIDTANLVGQGSYIDGVVFRQTAQNRDSASFPLVRFDTAYELSFNRATCRDADVPGIELRSCLDVDINQCRFENLTDNIGSNFIGYGINLVDACSETRINRAFGRFCRHLFTTSAGNAEYGVPRHWTLTACQSVTCNSSGFDPHRDGKLGQFIGCSSHSDGGQGFYIRSPLTDLIDCTVTGTPPGQPAITIAEGTSTDCKIIGGRIVMPAAATTFTLEIDSTGCTVDGLLIQGSGAPWATVRVAADDCVLNNLRSRNPGGNYHVSLAGSLLNVVINGGKYDSTVGNRYLFSAPSSSACRVIGPVAGSALVGYDFSAGANVVDSFGNTRSVTGATTIAFGDGTIRADATAGAFTVTLPTASAFRGAIFTIKKIDVSANAVTVGGTVDGAVNPTLASQYASMRVQSNGTSWDKV